MLYLIFALLLLPQVAQADCTCLWEGPFVDVQAQASLIVSGRVIEVRGNYIDLKTERILRGQSYINPIRVWLDKDDLCRAEVGTFPPESYWVMALSRIDSIPEGGFNPSTPNISYGRVGDYALSRCGGYWLSQGENLVTGNLVGGPRWERNPKMSPILIDLVEAFVRDQIDVDTLKEASRVDPELQELILNTRLFLRRGS
ncbi:MAG: delta-aminolevulinic acid dehydratase [Pseudomonadota bacterium]